MLQHMSAQTDFSRKETRASLAQARIGASLAQRDSRKPRTSKHASHKGTRANLRASNSLIHQFRNKFVVMPSNQLAQASSRKQTHASNLARASSRKLRATPHICSFFYRI